MTVGPFVWTRIRVNDTPDMLRADNKLSPGERSSALSCRGRLWKQVRCGVDAIGDRAVTAFENKNAPNQGSCNRHRDDQTKCHLGTSFLRTGKPHSMEHWGELVTRIEAMS